MKIFLDLASSFAGGIFNFFKAFYEAIEVKYIGEFLYEGEVYDPQIQKSPRYDILRAGEYSEIPVPAFFEALGLKLPATRGEVITFLEEKRKVIFHPRAGGGENHTADQHHSECWKCIHGATWLGEYWWYDKEDGRHEEQHRYEGCLCPCHLGKDWIAQSKKEDKNCPTYIPQLVFPHSSGYEDEVVFSLPVNLDHDGRMILEVLEGDLLILSLLGKKEMFCLGEKKRCSQHLFDELNNVASKINGDMKTLKHGIRLSMFEGNYALFIEEGEKEGD